MNIQTLSRLIKKRLRFSYGSLDGISINRLGVVFYLRDTTCLPNDCSKKQILTIGKRQVAIIPKPNNTALCIILQKNQVSPHV